MLQDLFIHSEQSALFFMASTKTRTLRKCNVLNVQGEHIFNYQIHVIRFAQRKDRKSVNRSQTFDSDFRLGLFFAFNVANIHNCNILDILLMKQDGPN